MVRYRESLTPLRKSFNNQKRSTQVSWELIEQDYLLSWMLAGICSVPELHDLFIFKGGTALKKVYFGEYRFSQDLDFTVIKSLPSDDDLDMLMKSACMQAMHLQSQASDQLIINYEQYNEKRPHPFNQKAYTIIAQFPWHREPLTRIMVEISTQEEVILPTPLLSVIHGYNEVLTAQIKTYALEEIISEKIRAILQFAQKLHERGWARSRARDYYDLWSILTKYKGHLDRFKIPEMVQLKCRSKGIAFKGPSSLFFRTTDGQPR